MTGITLSVHDLKEVQKILRAYLILIACSLHTSKISYRL